MATEFWSFQAKDWLNIAILAVTIIAVWFGPIRAVEVSRRNDVERARRARQEDTFRTLMRTRRTIAHPDKVASLNTIQVDFHDSASVMSAFQSYLTFLYRPTPTEGDAARGHQREATDLFYDLLNEVSKYLGYTFDKRDLERHSYLPNGMVNEEEEAQAFRTMVVQLLAGNRSLPIVLRRGASQNQANSKFPPPP